MERYSKEASINMREPEFKRIKPSCILGSYTHLTNRINRIDKSLFERFSPRFSESSGARRRYSYFPSILVRESAKKQLKVMSYYTF